MPSHGRCFFRCLAGSSLIASFEIAAEDPTFASSYPRFPTRGVRTIDTWTFSFDPGTTGSQAGVADKKQEPAAASYKVTVPDAFDLPLVRPTGSCGDECCDRALGRFGDEKCYRVDNGNILKTLGAAGELLDEEEEDDEGAVGEAVPTDLQEAANSAVPQHARGTSSSKVDTASSSSGRGRKEYGDCCRAETPYLHARGTGTYEAEVGGHITSLRVHACVFRCEVYVDDFLVASFVSGYAPVDVGLGKFRFKLKRIKIKANNEFDYEKVPLHQRKYDWYQAGGLVRPVEAHGGNFLMIQQLAVVGNFVKTKNFYTDEEFRRAERIVAGSRNSGEEDVDGYSDSDSPPPPPEEIMDPQMPKFHTSLSNALNLPSFPILEEEYDVASLDLHLYLDDNYAEKIQNYEFRLRYEDRCSGGGSAPYKVLDVSKATLSPYTTAASQTSSNHGSNAVVLTFRNVSAPPHAGQALWSPAAPNLHFASLAIYDKSDLLDCIVVRFGLRQIEAKFGNFYLNGKLLKLKGFNRHDMEPVGTGPAMTVGALYKDIKLLKSMNANFIRGAHYPQDQRFLDLCDEFGVLVWEESLGWQNGVQDFQNVKAKFLQQLRDSTRRMVFYSQNHPSVVVFGFLNEGLTSHPVSTEVYRKTVELIKHEAAVVEVDEQDDASRSTTAGAASPSTTALPSTTSRFLVSWASSSRFHDLNWAFADFLAFNSYEGWYPTREPVSQQSLQQIPETWDFSAAWAQDHFPGKPLMCSEFGAGGIFGRHGPSDGEKWTEEVQSLLLQLHTLSILKHEKLAGFALWQLTDALVDVETSDSLHRPRGLNNKGVLSMGRRPKTAFFAMRAILKEEFAGLILPEADTGKFENLIKMPSLV